MAASAAIARAAPTSARSALRSACGSTGAGRCDGNSPMRATGSASRHEHRRGDHSGERLGDGAVQPGQIRPSAAATTCHHQQGFRGGCPVGVRRRRATPRAVCAGPPGACWAIAAGTCCRKMIAAMPSVKPSMTGHGMNVTARPRPVTPAASTISPANTVTSATLPRPYWATTGASTTAIAPVGPDTWTCEPPKTAATRPATTAVIKPGRRADTGADAERQRQRQRDHADGDPGQDVAPPRSRQFGVVAAVGEQAARPPCGGRRSPASEGRQCLQGFQLIATRAEGVGQEGPGDDQQFGDLRVGQLVDTPRCRPLLRSPRDGA